MVVAEQDATGGQFVDLGDAHRVILDRGRLLSRHLAPLVRFDTSVVRRSPV
jgi:hypothetical protein